MKASIKHPYLLLAGAIDSKMDNTKVIITELAVDFDMIVEFTKDAFIQHLKNRLVDDPEDIETLSYTPLRIEIRTVIVYVRAVRKTALETGSTEEVRDSVVDSGVRVGRIPVFARCPPVPWNAKSKGAKI